MAIPPQGGGSGENPTFCLFIIDWVLEGAAVDTAYSPVLDLSELNPDAVVRLSFDFMHTDMLGYKFEVVYRTSETEPWQILAEALPSIVENEEFVFFNHYLFLSEEFFINSLQIGLAYTPEWFRVMISETGNDPSDFVPIDANSETYIEAPVK